MAKKNTRRNSDGPNPDSGGESGRDDSQQTPQVDDVVDWQPSAIDALMEDDDDGGTVTVKLNRLKPATVKGPDGSEIDIDGYLEDLPLDGVISYESYIAKKYGGGLFRLQRRVNNQIADQKTLKISGLPLCPAPIVHPLPPTLPAIQPTAESPLTETPQVIEVNGVQIPLNAGTKELFEAVTKMKLIQALFPPPVSVNDTLLNLALKRTEDRDPLQMVQTVTALAEAVRSFAGSGDGGGGTDITTLIAKGLDTLSSMIAASAGRGGTARAHGRAASIAAASPAVQIEDHTQPHNPESTEITDMTPQEHIKQKSMQAVACVVAGYKLDPPMAPQDMAEQLDFTLDLPPAVKALVKDQKKRLFNAALLQLADHFADYEAPITDVQSAFATWFDQVFDLFTNQPSAGVN